MSITLLDALRTHFGGKWPKDEYIGFSVDPDGEVRGWTITDNDFYPEVPISEEFISGFFAGFGGSKVEVTREQFEAK